MLSPTALISPVLSPPLIGRAAVLTLTHESISTHMGQMTIDECIEVVRLNLDGKS